MLYNSSVLQAPSLLCSKETTCVRYDNNPAFGCHAFRHVAYV